MNLKQKIKKLLGRGDTYTSSSDSYIAYLSSKGAQIGNDVHIFGGSTVRIDTQFPWMLEIGNGVKITEGCSILNHDWSASVWKGISGEVIGGVGKVKIGNNVFVGSKSTILMHTEIGDNVIIGAGSVVRGIVESNSVYAGVPAKRICSIGDYISKRKSIQIKEAKDIVFQYYKHFKKWPSQNDLKNYFALYAGSYECLTAIQKYELSLCGTEFKGIKWINNNKPMFDNFDSFIECCKKEL